MAEFSEASVERQLSQLSLDDEQSTLSSSLGIPAASDSRQSVSVELRMHLANQLFEAFATNESRTAAVAEHQTARHHRLAECAQKAEAEAFDAANSRSEYCESIAERICKIRNNQRACWRETVVDEVRKRVVDKLARAIVPGCDLDGLVDDERTSTRNLLEYARAVECEIFHVATSRSAYYKLIAEKIHAIQPGV